MYPTEGIHPHGSHGPQIATFVNVQQSGKNIASLDNPTEWFDNFDRNGSGSLDRNEVVNALAATFNVPPLAVYDTVNTVWSVFDLNGSGVIDRAEFGASGGMAEALRASIMMDQQSMLQQGSPTQRSGNTPVAAAVPVPSAPPMPNSATYIPLAVPVATTAQHTAAAAVTPGGVIQVFDNPAYVTRAPTTLIMKEKIFSFSGDSFSIKDQRGNRWFECTGRALSIREKKVITDAQRTPVFVMKEQIFTFAPSQYVYHPQRNTEGQHMFKIKSKLTFAKAKIQAVVTNKLTGEEILVVCKGDIFSFNATIYMGEPKRGGRPIARITRALTPGDFFFGSQTYHVDIGSGVDAALIVALCISFDELKNDRRD